MAALRGILHAGIGNPTGGIVTINHGRSPLVLTYDKEELFHVDIAVFLKEAFPYRETDNGTKCGFQVIGPKEKKKPPRKASSKKGSKK